MSLTDGLEQGTYTVSWRVVSADSHAVSGAFSISGGQRQTAVAPTVDPAVDAL
ncbi:copper resistance protein CopC [Streptomyces sp. NPDC026672]|uniref:copper resistance protein CopC n=1 Tax=unclassified Streptomyces TaxID=2593676 RepID=UPI0033E62CEA